MGRWDQTPILKNRRPIGQIVTQQATDYPARCRTCKHAKPPCAAAAGTCGDGCAHGRLVCRVMLNNPGENIDSASCRYYLPAFLRI
ncbi:MAG: hypothetical protein Kow0069_29620 [Promethearchaeota archaeon]